MMNTNKLNELANTIVNYSLKLKENSKVQVTFTTEATPLVEQLIKEAQKQPQNKLKIRMNYLIDEFANLPKMQNMDS